MTPEQLAKLSRKRKRERIKQSPGVLLTMAKIEADGHTMSALSFPAHLGMAGGRLKAPKVMPEVFLTVEDATLLFHGLQDLVRAYHVPGVNLAE